MIIRTAADRRFRTSVGAGLGSLGLALAGVVPPASAAPSIHPDSTIATAASSAAVALLPDPKIKGKRCGGNNGVTVVVDFRDLRNEAGRRMNLVKIGCARGAQEDGLAAIVDAGFDLQHRSGFVCRLDDRPLPEQTDCTSAGYWSYWHADRGGEWDYSSVGPGAWSPPAGSLEGWAWNWYDEAEASPRLDP